MTDENKQIIEVKQDEVKPVEGTDAIISKEEFLQLKAFKENAEKREKELEEKKKADEVAKLSEIEKIKLKEKEKEIELAKEQSKKEVMLDLLSADKDFLDFIHADKADDLKDYSYSRLLALNAKYKNQTSLEREKNKTKVKDTPGPIGNNGSGIKKKITDEDFIKEYSKK